MNRESRRSYYKNVCRFKMHWRHFKRRAGALWEILFLITFDCYSASSEIKVFFNQCNHHSLYKKPVKTFFQSRGCCLRLKKFSSSTQGMGEKKCFFKKVFLVSTNACFKFPEICFAPRARKVWFGNVECSADSWALVGCVQVGVR